jgi:hypothetical protein
MYVLIHRLTISIVDEATAFGLASLNLNFQPPSKAEALSTERGPPEQDPVTTEGEVKPTFETSWF